MGIHAAPATASRRDRLLQLLRESSEPRSIASLAEDMRVHPNTVRFHLSALVRTGDVEQLTGESAGPGRPPVLFHAVRRMDPAGPTNYRLLAEIMTTSFAANAADPSTAAVELGRRWGPELIDDRVGREPSRQESVAALTDVLADVGFLPEPPKSRHDASIRLRHCPFHDLIDTHREAICALHLGLMQGALSAIGGPVAVVGLDPLVEPDLCVAHLSDTRGRRAGSAASATR